MEQRILMYTYYRDSLNMTAPSLIDSMDNYFLLLPYDSGPDAAYVIRVDTTFGYTYDYIHTWNWPEIYDEIEEAIIEALKDVEIDQVAPSVEVTSPQAGEELALGDDYDIEWTATDNVGVTSRAMYLSKNNGSTWELIDSSDGNTGTYSWEVPTEASGECKIKVYAYDKAKNVGSNESGYFSIGPIKIIYNLVGASERILFKKAHESFMICLPFSGSNTVTISDVQGKQMASFTTSNDKIWYKVPVSLSSGMHIVSIKTPEKTIVRKFWLIR